LSNRNDAFACFFANSRMVRPKSLPRIAALFDSSAIVLTRHQVERAHSAVLLFDESSIFGSFGRNQRLGAALDRLPKKRLVFRRVEQALFQRRLGSGRSRHLAHGVGRPDFRHVGLLGANASPSVPKNSLWKSPSRSISGFCRYAFDLVDGDTSLSSCPQGLRLSSNSMSSRPQCGARQSAGRRASFFRP